MKNSQLIFRRQQKKRIEKMGKINFLLLYFCAVKMGLLLKLCFERVFLMFSHSVGNRGKFLIGKV